MDITLQVNDQAVIVRTVEEALATLTPENKSALLKDIINDIWADKNTAVERAIWHDSIVRDFEIRAPYMVAFVDKEGYTYDSKEVVERRRENFFANKEGFLKTNIYKEHMQKFKSTRETIQESLADYVRDNVLKEIKEEFVASLKKDVNIQEETKAILTEYEVALRDNMLPILQTVMLSAMQDIVRNVFIGAPVLDLLKQNTFDTQIQDACNKGEFIRGKLAENVMQKFIEKGILQPR